MSDVLRYGDTSWDAEVAVVGSILVDSRCLPTVRQEVGEESFLHDDCRAAFRAACALADKGGPVDPVTVRDEAPELTREFLLQAMVETPTARNAGAHAKIVAQEAARRHCVEMFSGAIDELCAGQDPAHVIGDIQQKTGKMLENRIRGDVVPLSSVLVDFMEKLQGADSGYSPFVSTGYRRLDSVLQGGLIQEGMCVLAARPGCGKTTFALNIALKVLQKGKRVLFVSLEMSREQIAARLMSLHSRKHTFSDIISGRLVRDNPDGWDQLTAAGQDVSKLALDVYDRSGVTVDRILLDAQSKQYDLIIIDYFGLIDHRNGSSRYDQTSHTSNEIKRMARKLGVPVLCLAQLNREVEGRNGGRPRLSDLRETGHLEQDSDCVLFIHPSTEEVGEGEGTKTEIIVAKNRHGPNNVIIGYDWFKRNGLFVESKF